jgi:hypothetical protein
MCTGSGGFSANGVQLLSQIPAGYPAALQLLSSPGLFRRYLYDIKYFKQNDDSFDFLVRILWYLANILHLFQASH